MSSQPNIIIEIGDRYCSNFGTGVCGFKLRAVVKFTHKTPNLPGMKSKDVKWFGPFGLKDDGVKEGDTSGGWGTAEAVKLLRVVADELERKDGFISADKKFTGDLLAVMGYELRDCS